MVLCKNNSEIIEWIRHALRVVWAPCNRWRAQDLSAEEEVQLKKKIHKT